MLPLLAIFALGLAWMVSIGVVFARAQDAARETARTIARGDQPAVGEAYGRRVAVTGSRVSVSRGGGMVTATVVSPVRGPGGLLAFLPVVRVHASSATAVEQSQAGP